MAVIRLCFRSLVTCAENVCHSVQIWGSDYSGMTGELVHPTRDFVDDREYELKLTGVTEVQVRKGKYLKS